MSAIRHTLWRTRSGEIYRNLASPTGPYPNTKHNVCAVCYTRGVLVVADSANDSDGLGYSIEHPGRKSIPIINGLPLSSHEMMCTGEIFILWRWMMHMHMLYGWRSDGTPIRVLTELVGDVVVPPPGSRWAGHFALRGDSSVSLYDSDMNLLWGCECPPLTDDLKFDMRGECLAATTRDGLICVISAGAVEMIRPKNPLGKVAAAFSSTCILISSCMPGCGQLHICRPTQLSSDLVLESSSSWPMCKCWPLNDACALVVINNSGCRFEMFLLSVDGELQALPYHCYGDEYWMPDIASLAAAEVAAAKFAVAATDEINDCVTAHTGNALGLVRTVLVGLVPTRAF